MSDKYEGVLLRKIRIGHTNFGAGVSINTALAKAERDYEMWHSGEAERIKKRAEKTVIDVALENAKLQAENERLNQLVIELSNKRDKERIHCDELGNENTLLKSDLYEAHRDLEAEQHHRRRLSERLDQYESTPERGLKAVMGFHCAEFVSSGTLDILANGNLILECEPIFDGNPESDSTEMIGCRLTAEDIEV